MAKIKFVGRHKELDTLARALTNHEEKEIVLIDGEGGIGKSMLLSKFREKYYDYPKVKATEIIDLSQVAFKQQFILLNLIAEHFDKKNFNDYFTYWSDYQKLQGQGGSAKSLNDIREKAENSFIKEFNSLSQQKRLVLILDTFDEEIYKTDSILYLFENIILRLNKFMLLVAGRVTNKLSDLFEEKKLIHLAELEKEASEDLIPNVPKEYKDKVIKLAGQKGLILSLANTYFNIPKLSVPEILKKQNSYIIENLQKSKEEFEKQLFEIFGDYKYSPHPNIIMQMAFFEKRYNVAIMCHINNISEKEAEKILSDLSSEFFVKNHPGEIHLLHDIFRDKLRDLEWNRLDNKDPKLRVEYSKKIEIWYNSEINKFEQQIELNEKNIKNSNEANTIASLENKNYELEDNIGIYKYEKYFYSKKSDKQKAYDNLEKEIHNAISSDKIKLIRLLSDIPTTEDLNIHFGLKYELARFYRIIGEFDKASEFLNFLIIKDTNELKKIEYLQTLSFVYKEKGDLSSAETELKNADEIINKEEDKNNEKVKDLKAFNYNNFGLLYTELGLLSKAVEFFKTGIDFAKEYELGKREASLKGNLGLTLLLQGDIENAEITLNDAIELNKDFDDEFRVNINSLFLAQAKARNGAFKSAYKLIDSVKEYFKKQDQQKWLAIVYMYESRIRFEDFVLPNYGEFTDFGNREKEEEFLNNTLKLAKDSDELCEKFHRNYLDETYMHTGNILLEFAKFYKNTDKKQFDKYANQSFEIINNALEITKNLRIRINLWEILAEYYSEFDNIDKLDELYKYVEKNAPKGSSMKAYEGEITFMMARYYVKKDVEKALSYFNISIPRLAEPGEWPELNFEENLKEIEDVIMTLDKSSADKWINEFSQNWIDKKDNPIPTKQQKIITLFLSRLSGKIKRKFKK